MALITCPECGKRISDTITLCIHCGAPVALASSEEAAAEQTLEKETDTPRTREEEKRETRSFSELDPDARELLEVEFIANNTWAKKYLRAKRELWSFMCGGLVLFWVCFMLLVRLPSHFIPFEDFETVNPAFETLALVCLVLYGVLYLFMLVYGIVTKIRLSVTQSRYVYMKKFGIWLEREKKISYIPPLVTEKEKEIYDSIVLEEESYGTDPLSRV